MTEKLGDDSETIVFEAMYGVVVFCELLLKKIVPHAVELAKPFSNQSKKLVVCALLGGAFYKHGWQFVFQPSRKINSQ